MKQFLLIGLFFFAVSLSANAQEFAPVSDGDEVAMISSDPVPTPASVSTYPNPVVDKLHVEIDYNTFNPNKWQLYDMLGNVVLEGDILQNERFRIDLSQEENQIYFLQVFDASGHKITKRIIKK